MIVRRRVFFSFIGAGAMGAMVFAGLGKPADVTKAIATTSASKLLSVGTAKAKLRKGPCWLV